MKELSNKWKPQESDSSNSFSLYYMLSLLGTKNIEILKNPDILKKFEKITDWAQFISISSLGLIY